MPDFFTKPKDAQNLSLLVAASENVGQAQKSIVLGYRDGASERVLAETIHEATARGAAVRVVMFSADDPTSPNYSEFSGVKQVARQLIDANLEFEIFRPSEDVGEQVLEVAEKVNAELIVLSIRKRSPMLKMILGSSAQRILLGATCPVLSIK